MVESRTEAFGIIQIVRLRRPPVPGSCVRHLPFVAWVSDAVFRLAELLCPAVSRSLGYLHARAMLWGAIHRTRQVALGKRGIGQLAAGLRPLPCQWTVP